MSRGLTPEILSSLRFIFSFMQSLFFFTLNNKKPDAILVIERKRREELKRMKAQREPKEGDVECNTQ